MLRKKKSFSVEVIVIETIVLFYHKKRKKTLLLIINCFSQNVYQSILHVSFITSYFHQLCIIIYSFIILVTSVTNLYRCLLRDHSRSV